MYTQCLSPLPAHMFGIYFLLEEAYSCLPYSPFAFSTHLPLPSSFPPLSLILSLVDGVCVCVMFLQETRQLNEREC